MQMLCPEHKNASCQAPGPKCMLLLPVPDPVSLSFHAQMGVCKLPNRCTISSATFWFCGSPDSHFVPGSEPVCGLLVGVPILHGVPCSRKPHAAGVLTAAGSVCIQSTRSCPGLV